MPLTTGHGAAVIHRAPYAPDRKSERPMTHLEGFTGILQVDGYASYRKLVDRGDVRLAFCWSHVRRGFGVRRRRRALGHRRVPDRDLRSRHAVARPRRLMLSRQADDFARFCRRRRLQAEIAHDSNNAHDLLDIGRKLAARIVEIILKADADVTAE
jgi:Transposase IS66 family